MNKKNFLVFFIFIINAILVSSSIEIQNNNYAPGETFVAFVTEENFRVNNLLMEDNTSKDLGLGFQRIQKTENKYMVYLDLPQNIKPGKYTLKYKRGDSDITSDFNIITSNTSMRITPLFIKYDSSKSSFKILLTNIGTEDNEIEISSTSNELEPVRSSILVPPDESRNLFVNYDKVTSDATLKLTYEDRTYFIDVLTGDTTISETYPTSSTTEKIRINGLELIDARPIEHTINTKQTIEGSLPFRNKLTIPIYNVSFHLTPELANIIDFQDYRYKIIQPGEVVNQFIWINKNKNARPGDYIGTLLIQSPEGDKVTLDFKIIILDTIDEPIIEDLENETPEDYEGETIIIEDGQGEDLEVTGVNFTNDSDLGGILLVDGPEKDPATGKNRTLGLILVFIIITIGGFLIWKLRPQEKKLKFTDYITPFKKGQEKKK